MATPMQYTSQFIPTNVGLMNQQLGQMQQRHDQASANLTATQDKYADILVDPSDIAGKQAIMDRFSGKAQEVIDRFGGDYGAASKELTRLISKTKQDPFFQLAPYKRAIAEEERKRTAQLGLNAIPTRSVSDTQVYNPETGEYASKDELGYEVLDRRDIESEYARQYGDLAKASQDVVMPGRFEGYNRSRTYKGLRENEVEGVINDSFQYIKSLNPNIPDATAMDIASNMTNQMVGGFQDRDIRDLTYDADSGDKAPPVAPGLKYKNREMPGQTDTPIEDISKKWSKFAKRSDEYQATYGALTNAAGQDPNVYYRDKIGKFKETLGGESKTDYNTLSNVVTKASSIKNKGTEAFDTGQEILETMSNLGYGGVDYDEKNDYYKLRGHTNESRVSPSPDLNRFLEDINSKELLEQHVSEVSNPIFQDLIGAGFSSQDAAGVMSNFESSKYLSTNTAFDLPSKEVESGIINELKGSVSKQKDIEYINEDGDRDTEETSIQAILKGGNLNKIEVVPATGQLSVNVGTDDGFKNYMIDAENLQEPTSGWLDLSKELSTAIYDPSTRGDVIPLENAARTPNGNQLAFVVRKKYDANSRSIIPTVELAEIEGSNILASQPISEQEANDYILKNMFASFGQSTKVEPNKVKF